MPSAAFSASSRIFDLNGNVTSARKKHSSATIFTNAKQFCRQIDTDGVLGTHRWRSFLRNHAADIAAMDLFVVPTIGFGLLDALVIVRLARRDLVWSNVTANPTADWIAHQITRHSPGMTLPAT